MKLFDNEKILFTSNNKRFILTTHRIRNENKSFWGSEIKSLLLEELSFSELKTIIPYQMLLKVLLAPIIINGAVFLINNFLFKSSLLIFFFEEILIESEYVVLIFYFSLVISAGYLIYFFLSFRKIISFYASNKKVDVELKWLNFNERENFISKVELAKMDRITS